MSYKITCESCADLNKEMYKKHNIAVIPFNITLGDKDFQDGVNVSNTDLFNFFNETKQLPKTSAINEFDYDEFFKKELKVIGNTFGKTFEHLPFLVQPFLFYLHPNSTKISFLTY